MSLLMRSGPPRAAPYPGDVSLGGESYRVLHQRGAGLVAIKEPEQSGVSPPAYGYAAQDPRYEGVQVYGRMRKGYGLAVQEGPDDEAYFYATGVDASVYPWLCGPNITTINPDGGGTEAITHFFQVGTGASARLYALQGRYALVRAGDAAADWTVSRDFGAGVVALDVVVFYSAALGQSRAWVALDTGNLFHFDDTTGTTNWTQATGAMTARAFAVVGREFYRAVSPNTLAKCDTNADPTAVGNWNSTNQYRVGDLNTTILRMTTNAEGVLVILGDNGIFSLDETGQDIDYFKHLRFAQGSSNALGYAHFADERGEAIYVNYLQGYYRLSPSFELLPAGPERQLRGGAEAVNPVRGRITAAVGHDTHRLYAGIYNGADAYIVVMNPDGVWHGSISNAFTGRRITAMFKSSIGAGTGNVRLYLGFENGDIGWFRLPDDPYPDDDADYVFRSTAGIMYLPLWHGGFLTDAKVLRRVTVSGPLLNDTNYAQFDYRTNPSVSGWTALGENFGNTPSETANFAAGTTTTLAAFRVQMVPPTTAGASSPQAGGVAVHWSRRSLLAKSYHFSVLAEDGLVLRNGAGSRRGAGDIRRAMESVASAGVTTLVLPSEELRQVSIVNYQEAQEWDNRLRRWRATIQVEAADLQTVIAAGTYARLELRTYGQLETVGAYSSLETLV